MATVAKHVVEVRMIPLADIDESPSNKRRTWGNLNELAQSIREVGVLEPAMARPVGGRFELVFGHRRYRASKLAGARELPVVVRELTDAQALEIQAVENLQRTDLHELEEAEGFEQLQHLGWSVDELAAKLGKSRAYVYGRLKLLELVPEARTAFYAGRLSSSVALYVARVPQALQVEALKELEEEAREYSLGGEREDEAPEPIPAREAQRLLRDRYTLRLANAPFDRGDAELVPGAGACSACPKRSGAQPELFSDVESPDVCTDPTCFGRKREAAEAKVRARLEKKGLTVLPGKRDHGSVVRPPSGYVRADERCWEAGQGNKTYAEVAKVAKVAKQLDVSSDARAVMIDERGKPVELLRKAVVLKAVGVKDKGSQYKPPTPEEQAAQELKREAVQMAEDVAVEATIAKVEACSQRPQELAKVLRVALMCVQRWRFGDVAQRRKWPGDAAQPALLQKLSLPQLLGLAVEVLAEDIRPLATHVGVDVKALEKKALADLKAKAAADVAAKPAKPAAKKGGKK